MSLDHKTLYRRWRRWMDQLFADIPSLTFMISSRKGGQEYGIWLGGHFRAHPNRHVNDNRRLRNITKEIP